MIFQTTHAESWYENLDFWKVWVPVITVLLSGIGYALKKWFFTEKPEKMVAGESWSSVRDTEVSGAQAGVAGRDLNQTITNYYGPTEKIVGPQTSQTFPQSQLKAEEVFNYIQRLTPYQKQQPITIYDGVEISWVVNFQTVDIHHTADGEEGNVLCFPLQLWIDVSFGVELNKIPRLKSTHGGTSIGVKGTIASVTAKTHPPIIRVNNVEITFFD
jgi:hypothetical protein